MRKTFAHKSRMDNELQAQLQVCLVLWLLHILTVFKRICRKFLLLSAGTRLKNHAFNSNDGFLVGGDYVHRIILFYELYV